MKVLRHGIDFIVLASLSILHYRSVAIEYEGLVLRFIKFFQSFPNRDFLRPYVFIVSPLQSTPPLTRNTTESDLLLSTSSHCQPSYVSHPAIWPEGVPH